GTGLSRGRLSVAKGIAAGRMTSVVKEGEPHLPEVALDHPGHVARPFLVGARIADGPSAEGGQEGIHSRFVRLNDPHRPVRVQLELDDDLAGGATCEAPLIQQGKPTV